MGECKYWKTLEELPTGWKFDPTAGGSPLHGYSFASDGKSVLRGGKRALVRKIPAQRLLFPPDVQRVSPEKPMENPIGNGARQVIDASSARTVNELAREKFKQRVLNDILMDLMICEIEGWCKVEYINQMKELICSLAQRECIDA